MKKFRSRSRFRGKSRRSSRRRSRRNFATRTYTVARGGLRL